MNPLLTVEPITYFYDSNYWYNLYFWPINLVLNQLFNFESIIYFEQLFTFLNQLFNLEKQKIEF